MVVREMDCQDEMKTPDSGSCPMVGFDHRQTEPSGSPTRGFIKVKIW